MDSTHALQIVVTAGQEARPRAELALQTALAAVSSGIRVHLFLTLAGGIWACRDGAGDVDSSVARVQRLLDQLVQLGVTVECCARCSEKQCGGDDPTLLRPGVHSAGLVSMATRAVRMQTLTF